MGFQRIAVKKKKFQIDPASTRSISGVQYDLSLQTYCAKPMLRKHYKEGASVVTHFRVSTKIKKNSQKDQKK